MLYHKKVAGILTGLLILSAHLVFAQEEIALYRGTIPNAKQVADAEINKDGIASKVSRPSLTIFLPDKEKANGAAVIICPGGGYGVLMMQLEGIQTARYFQQRGVAAFVLKYRLPDDMTMQDKSMGPLQDAQQAIKRVRMQAREWNIDTARVGIMGFSAGGHLAATASTHFADEEIENGEKVSLRPDFSLLVYPVISMTDLLGHRGSRDNLLGKAPSPEKIKWFSNEEQVTTETPPAFLIQAADDRVVDVDNSIAYFEALRHHQVPAEMHIYPRGDHGFVLHIPIDEWMSLCLKWMSSNGWLEAK